MSFQCYQNVFMLRILTYELMPAKLSFTCSTVGWGLYGMDSFKGIDKCKIHLKSQLFKGKSCHSTIIPQLNSKKNDNYPVTMKFYHPEWLLINHAPLIVISCSAAQNVIQQNWGWGMSAAETMCSHPYKMLWRDYLHKDDFHTRIHLVHAVLIWVVYTATYVHFLYALYSC